MNDFAGEEDKLPSEHDPHAETRIFLHLLPMLPIVVTACNASYRFRHVAPLKDREKAELTRIFQTLDCDNGTEMHKKVTDFFFV